MQLQYDEDLVEAVVLLLAGNRRSGIAPLQLRRFHAERDRCYRLLDADERNAAFFKLHLEWFREWGIESALAAIVGHFPNVKTHLHVLAFRKARGKHEEASELYVNDAGERHGMIAVLPERFARNTDTPVRALERATVRALDRGGQEGPLCYDPSRPYPGSPTLEAFLNHELQHLADMVDPAFGYSPRVRGAPASPERLIRERYRLLWDVTIDGRLCQGRLPTVASREQRQNEFDRAHAFLPLDKRSQIFERLWTNPTADHSDLLSLAADPKGLSRARRPEPGATCPLCGFPSFHWADVTTLAPDVAAQIVIEFSDWRPEHGICRRCVEVYESARSLQNHALADQICISPTS